MAQGLSTAARQIMLEIYRRGGVATVEDISDGIGVTQAEVDDALSSAELYDYTRRARVYGADGAVLTIAAEDWCEAQQITPASWLQLPGLDDAGHVHLSDRAATMLTRTVLGRREVA